VGEGVAEGLGLAPVVGLRVGVGVLGVPSAIVGVTSGVTVGEGVGVAVVGVGVEVGEGIKTLGDGVDA